MRNLWSEVLKDDQVKIPKEILEEQSIYLQKMTKDLVYATVEDITSYDDDADELAIDDSDLAFKFSLRSKYIGRYSFTLFAFTHGIEIYPVRMQLDSLIAKEIGMNTTIYAESEEVFIEHLEKIFGTKRTRTVIGAITKLANTYK